MTWSAVWVKSRHEQVVKLHLDVQGVTSFLPLFPAVHRWADRNKVLRLPMIPNYVFCAFSSEHPPSIRHIPGVVDYVRCGAAIAHVDSKEIDALKRAVAESCAAEPWPTLVTGQAVEITGGPLAGMTGTVVEHKSCLKLVLTVTLLQRSILVEINPKVLRLRGPVMAIPVLASVEGSPNRRKPAARDRVGQLNVEALA